MSDCFLTPFDWNIFVHPFIYKAVCIFKSRCVSCWQQIRWSSLDLFSQCMSFDVEPRLLVLKVILEMSELPVVVVLIFGIFSVGLVLTMALPIAFLSKVCYAHLLFSVLPVFAFGLLCCTEVLGCSASWEGFWSSVMTGQFCWAYFSPIWPLKSFRPWNALLQGPLAFRVSTEKSAVILMDFPLYDLQFFSCSFQYTFSPPPPNT